MGRKTALYDCHCAAGGRMIEFAGSELPVRFPAGTIAEHKAVREHVGVFDVSHMAELLVSGEQALSFLDGLLTNHLRNLVPGRMRYCLMLNERGGVVDDLLVYALEPERFMLVLNAANHVKDRLWIEKQAALYDDLHIEDISEQTSQIALQGPESETLLSSLFPDALNLLPSRCYSFTRCVALGEGTVLLSRNGYTGEDGFELYGDAASLIYIYKKLLAVGVQPCGLGARDTLRLEAGLPLYGHELSETIRPDEAGLSFAAKLDKACFIGKEALLNSKPTRRRVGLRLLGRGIAREGCKVLSNGDEIGMVTSGTMLPTLGVAGAMAYLGSDWAAIGQNVEVEIRGKTTPAVVCALPFYQRC